MLTIRPNVSDSFYRVPAFGDRRRGAELSPEEKDKFEYDKEYKDVKKQKEDLESIAKDDEIKMPKPAKKVLMAGSVVASGILAGMATGWGGKKSIEAVRKLIKTKPMQSFKTGVKSFFANIGKGIKTLKTAISEKLTKMGKSKNVVKFKQSSFGKKLTAIKNSKIMKLMSGGLKKFGAGVKNFFKSIYNKIRGIKSEKVEKVATNTVAVSGGLSGSYMAYKQEHVNDADEVDNDYNENDDNEDED